MQMGTFTVVIDMYTSYKFGGLLSSISAVNAIKLCTVGIDRHSISSSKFTKGQHVCASPLLDNGDSRLLYITGYQLPNVRV